MACLKHLLRTASNASLMTPELMQTLWDHAIGNYRVLTSMAAELLASAARQEITQLDEKLYLETFGAPTGKPRKSSESLPPQEPSHDGPLSAVHRTARVH